MDTPITAALPSIGGADQPARAGWRSSYTAAWRQLTRRRQALGLTQDELGRRIGRAGRTVRRWEGAETDMTVTELFLLADRLGLQVRIEPRPEAEEAGAGDRA